jgi:hypothetical protein
MELPVIKTSSYNNDRALSRLRGKRGTMKLYSEGRFVKFPNAGEGLPKLPISQREWAKIKGKSY